MPEPHGRRCRTPVDVNRSLVSTPRSPSRKFDGGVDVARRADHRREHRRVGALALGHARRLDLRAEPDAGEIRIVLDGAADGLVHRQLKRLAWLDCAEAARRRQINEPEPQDDQRAFHIPVSVYGRDGRRKRRLQMPRRDACAPEACRSTARRTSVKNVPMTMPVTSMMPMLLRAPAPGPLASTSGKCPTTVAAVVIRIGRSRVPDGFDDRGELVSARFLQVIGELDDQDAVLRHEPDQRDEPDLAVDVQAREPEEREQQRAGDGQRHRPRENDERIAEALELRREHQIDQDGRQQERAEEPAALRPQLARLSRVVDREPLRQGGARFIFEEAQRLIERNGRRDHTLYADRVELLEFLQLARLCGGLQRGEGRERHELVARAGDVDAGQLFGREPFARLICGITL